MGILIRNTNFVNDFVPKMVSKWAEDVRALSLIAKEKPHAAYAGYTAGLSHRWSFLQRTAKCSSELFAPLETAIRNELIPELLGKSVDDKEREIISLPVRFGGLGILNPVQSKDVEYNSSVKTTKDLTHLIYSKETEYSMLDSSKMRDAKKKLKEEKESSLKVRVTELETNMSETQRRLFHCSMEKGASSWLTVMPTKRLGYVLNKQEFQDAMRLRYGWPIPNTPSYCGCGKKNSLDHVITCPKGGYIYMRHNALRDLEARLLSDICTDVCTEPQLLPTDDPEFSNSAEKARPDVSARGIWSLYEKTFLDVQITHPTSTSYMAKTMDQLFKEKENAKKRMYNQRIIDVEKASFTPLIFSTTGGMAPECQRYHKRIATLIALKRNEDYGDVMRWLRVRLRFALLKSILIAVRGYRGKPAGGEQKECEVSEISFNLV